MMADLVLSADGKPLRASLNRALRRQKWRALALIAPLLLFVMVSFVAPIGDMLFRSVENQMVGQTLPRTLRALKDWNGVSVPQEPVFAALYTDLVVAEEFKLHTRLGTRLNYEYGGASSLFRGGGRAVGKFGTDIYMAQFAVADPALSDPAQWVGWMANSAIRAGLPETSSAYGSWVRIMVEVKKKDPAAEPMYDFVYAALYDDLSRAVAPPGFPTVDVSGFESLSLRDAFLTDDPAWGETGLWTTLRNYGGPYTAGYFLNAVDMQIGADGIEMRPEAERIYITLFIRTIILSVTITATCIVLGYPIAWLLANLPNRTANLLMILVLLPFWTSLLVRTSAWKVLLQQQGVINDLLVWAGLVGEDNRLVMINNQTGTIIAMTHILMPFMILPLYSVMKGIPPTYLRAAKSLGATNWTAFWRVYFPQSVPGIGAGSILVFILAIGYYITPELVGGNKGVFISNRIAFHIGTSLNWGLAAALGAILLVLVLALYWAYDRLVGIDNVKLGG